MPLTIDGKKLVAQAMYNKGKAFIGAAILVGRNGGDAEHVDYVALHLLCQGVEITLKGLLLVKDFDRYWPRLQKKLGHNLVKIAWAASTAYGRKPPRGALSSELTELSKGYADHQFRYGGLADIFIRPQTRPRNRVLRYMCALIVLVERGVAAQRARGDA